MPATRRGIGFAVLTMQGQEEGQKQWQEQGQEQWQRKERE